MRTVLGRFARLAPVAAVLVGVLAGVGNLITDGPGGVRNWDVSVTRWLADHRERWLDRATEAATWLADTWTIVAATAVLAAGAAWWTRRWWLPAGIALLTAGETTIYELSNTLVDRPRPPVLRLDPGDPTASFPSGHVAASVCLYGGVAAVLLHRAHWLRRDQGGTGSRAGGRRASGWRRGAAVAAVGLSVAVAVVVPLVVAFCRTYRGMHHPTDVTAGALLGLCWLVTVNHVVLSRDVLARDVVSGDVVSGDVMSRGVRATPTRKARGHALVADGSQPAFSWHDLPSHTRHRSDQTLRRQDRHRRS